jgi:hypothetical protein
VTAVPQWAERVLDRTAERLGVPRPDVTWRRSRGKWYSTGVTYNDDARIVVTAGTDSQNARLVLLHEFAHYVIIKEHGPGDSHSARFWKVAFDLYAAEGLLRYAAQHEHQDGAKKEATRRLPKPAKPRPVPSSATTEGERSRAADAIRRAVKEGRFGPAGTKPRTHALATARALEKVAG